MHRRLALSACLVLLAPATAGAHEAKPPRIDLQAKRAAQLDLGRASAAAPDALADTWCPTDPGRGTDDTDNEVTKLPDVKVIYAYPSDRPNNFLRYADEIQKSMKDMAGAFASAPGSTKSVRFDLGTVCGPQYLDIQTVRLGGTHADLWAMDANVLATHLTIFGGLRDAGLVNPGRPRNYIVYVDGVFNGSASGLAPEPGDVRPGPDNFLNTGGRTAFTFGYDDQTAPYRWYGDTLDFTHPHWRVHVPLHELLHSIGAVLDPAPHSTGLGHCWDEWDVVCSNDGSTYTSNLTTTCPGEGNLEIDCGDDDYFRPAGGLTDRFGQPIWNTYDSVFLCRTDRCVNSPPQPAFSVAFGADGVGTFNADSTGDDDGIARYEWDLDGDGSYETDSGRSARATRTFDALGERTASLRVTDTDGLVRTASQRFQVTALAAPGTGAGGGSGSGAAVAASIGSLVVSPKKFRVPRSTRGRAATVRFSLDKDAEVAFAVEKAASGRRSGRNCVKPTKRNRKARKCTRYVKVRGSLGRPGKAGANSFSWNGRLGTRKLGVGSYRLRATPAGGAARTASFSVKR